MAPSETSFSAARKIEEKSALTPRPARSDWSPSRVQAWCLLAFIRASSAVAIRALRAIAAVYPGAVFSTSYLRNWAPLDKTGPTELDVRERYASADIHRG